MCMALPRLHTYHGVHFHVSMIWIRAWNHDIMKHPTVVAFLVVADCSCLYQIGTCIVCVTTASETLSNTPILRGDSCDSAERWSGAYNLLVECGHRYLCGGTEGRREGVLFQDISTVGTKARSSTDVRSGRRLARRASRGCRPRCRGNRAASLSVDSTYCCLACTHAWPAKLK